MTGPSVLQACRLRSQEAMESFEKHLKLNPPGSPSSMSLSSVACFPGGWHNARG